MGKIRPFIKEDIPQVVNLHPRSFEDSNNPSGTYFEEVFLNNPWFEESIPSLVCEQDNGKIIGFLGVIQRRFLFKRRTIQAAIASQFMVDPLHRSTMAGLQLIKTFLAGPQDLSIADVATFATREIWRVFQSHTMWLYSMRWRRVLRASSTRRLQSLLRKYKLSVLSRPFHPAMEAFEERIRGRRFRPKTPQVSEVEINENTIVAHLHEFVSSQFLRPEYDEQSLKWILKRAAAQKQFGKLQKVGVSNGVGEIIGWYIYQLSPGGSGRVLHIAARQNFVKEVLDSLFYRAWREQANAVVGRLEPFLIPSLVTESNISCHFSETCAMLHARDPELLSMIHRGDAFLTELEGEDLMHPLDEELE
jgi:hypothetical protein